MIDISLSDNMIRVYNEDDKEQLIDVLKLNIPQYFDPSEEQGFIEYLENETEDYFVIEENAEIIGSVGINYFSDKNEACISWDVIHPDHQGKGYGKELTLYRIKILKSNPDIKSIVVRTSQLTSLFYSKMGFVLYKIIKDFWAKGYDLYEMKMHL